MCNNKLTTIGLLKMFFDSFLKLLMNHNVLSKAKPINIGSEGKSILDEPISNSKEKGRIAINAKYNQVGRIIKMSAKTPANGRNAIQYSFIQRAIEKLRI